MEEELMVNNKKYRILALLGKGKGGYSYLVTDGLNRFVLKQIHHEPCTYYRFGNKVEAEINDYKRLSAIGIRLPAMLDIDMKREHILKEYIEGDTILDIVMEDKMLPDYFRQILEMSDLLFQSNMNIDYFPANFVVQHEKLYYIDFECNAYSEEWNFENWGKKYWTKSPELLDYVRNINRDHS